MAIDLPPGIAPALSNPQEIRDYNLTTQNPSGHSVKTFVTDYEVIIHGDLQLPAEDIISALQQGSNLSEAVWQLHFAYMAAGFRLTRLRYALKNKQLYIRVIKGHIRAIEGPASLTKYFWDVDGKAFDLPAFEPRRILSNLQAKRLGLKTQAYYDPVSADSKEIVITLDATQDSEYSPYDYQVEIGNPGNRFVGRHYALGSASLHTDNLQWKASLNRSLSGLDDKNERGGELTGYQLSANSVLPVGLFAIGIGKTEYEYDGNNGLRFDASVTQAQMLMQEIAHADIQQRTILSQRLLYVNAITDELSTVQTVQDEQYFAAEIGIEHTHRLRVSSFQPSLKLSADIRKGLSDNSGTLGSDQTPSRRDARFTTFKPGLNLSLTTENGWKLVTIAESQWSDRPLPEQQQWFLGGIKRMRAWLPGTLLGDEGHYLAFEGFAPTREITDRWQLDSHLFLEAGQSDFKTRTGNFMDKQTSVGIGAGLILRYQPQWSLEFIMAESISDSGIADSISSSNDADFFFSLKWDM